MNENNENNENIETESEAISQLNLHSVLIAISISDKTNFDYENEVNLLNNVFDKCLSADYKLTPTDVLERNTTQLNVGLAEIIKYCYNVINYKKPAFIFIIFCDYFDLNYNVVYKKLHHKFQTVIEANTRKIIGNNKFNKHKLKANDGVIITSLFDLTKNNKTQ